jgi:hypothetical protein
MDVFTHSKAWKLFVTGENKTPDLRYYDHSLSFCRFSFEGRNYRWPIWYQSLSIGSHDTGTFTPAESETIIETNRPLYAVHSKDKWNRILSVFNNCEPIRCEVFDSFAKRQIIDGIGAPFNNALAWGDESTYRTKIERLKSYGFNLCFENTLSDGYYTEKILHARASGCVPLIYAEPHVGQDFDLSSCLNLYDYETISDYCDHVHDITRDHSTWQELASRPIFAQKPDRDTVQVFIRKAYEDFTAGTVPKRTSQFNNMADIIYPESLQSKIIRKIRALSIR